MIRHSRTQRLRPLSAEGQAGLHLQGEGSPEVVELLVERGADLSARTHQGITPLMIGESTGRSEIGALLRTLAPRSGLVDLAHLILAVPAEEELSEDAVILL